MPSYFLITPSGHQQWCAPVFSFTWGWLNRGGPCNTWQGLWLCEVQHPWGSCTGNSDGQWPTDWREADKGISRLDFSGSLSIENSVDSCIVSRFGEMFKVPRAQSSKQPLDFFKRLMVLVHTWYYANNQSNLSKKNKCNKIKFVYPLAIANTLNSDFCWIAIFAWNFCSAPGETSQLHQGQHLRRSPLRHRLHSPPACRQLTSWPTSAWPWARLPRTQP